MTTTATDLPRPSKPRAQGERGSRREGKGSTPASGVDVADESAKIPQNPYCSYLVAASAGSGKTYQLSRRFLFLVGAGAPPASILTVTFTKKAAGEMRSRILEDAVRLASSPAEQAKFTVEQEAFYHEAQHRLPHLRLAPPRHAAVTAQAILASSQALRISTIDSLFLEWVSKFPYEAGGVSVSEGSPEGHGLPVPLRLIDGWQQRHLADKAWYALGRLVARGLEREDAGFHDLLQALDYDFAIAEGRLRALARMETFVWHGEAGGTEAFRPHPLPACPASSDSELVALLQEPLLAIASVLSQPERRQRCIEAIAAKDLEGVFQTELLTRGKLAINGALIRGKKREALAAEVNKVDTLIGQFYDRRRLERLNTQGRGYYTLYQYYRQLSDHLKYTAGGVEFSDLAKGCFRLFTSDEGLGVRYLLARTTRHLLLDEFQDTSRLQWAIFHELAGQLLAGDGAEAFGDRQGHDEGPPPTVFIVGDEKQSIYGFREADPAVLSDAAAVFSERIVQAPLNRSYRTAQVVLDFVNSVFTSGTFAIPGFPHHCTATQQDQTPVVPDSGRVLITPLISDKDRPAEELEAEYLAGLLAQALSGAFACPVYDKTSQSYRPLRASDCAVLYRAATKAELIENALRARGIASKREEQRGFFARTEIADAVALLRFLAVPSDLLSLLTVLRSPMGRCSDDTMLAALNATRRLSGQPRVQAFLSHLKASQPEFVRVIRHLLADAGGRLPHELLVDAFDHFAAFAAYGLSSGSETNLGQINRSETNRSETNRSETNDAKQLIKRNLCRLIELCMELEGHSQSSGQTGLLGLVQRLEFLAQTDETGCAEVDADAVTLMTIHKSKGLEFPLVVIADTGRAWGQTDRYWVQSSASAGSGGVHYVGRRGSQEQPVADRSFSQLNADLETSIQDECQRLLYVALTRARQYLVITGHEVERNRGVNETTVYQRLAAALEDQPHRPVLATPLANICIKQWSSLSCELQFAAVNSAHSKASTDVDTRKGAKALSHSDFLTRAVVLANTTTPAELRLVSPSSHVAHHDADDDQQKAPVGSSLGYQAERRRVRRPLNRSDAISLGLFVHAAMEAFVKKQNFTADIVWQNLSGTAAKGEIYDLACMEAARITQDPQWRDLLGTAKRIEAELPIVHLSDDQLMTGTIDLLIEMADGRILLVDYKTSLLLERDEEAYSQDELHAFCKQKGWFRQLAMYRNAAAALYAGRPVDAQLYLTSLSRFVDLIA